MLGQRVLGTGKDWETEAFQKDVADLPDTSTLEEYTAMPVEAFGEAMLRGMGWSEHKETTKVLFCDLIYLRASQCFSEKRNVIALGSPRRPASACFEL